MKIIRLEASNFLHLIAIDITPSSEFNAILGPNGSGKSSLIDCIPALTGGASEVPGMPIRLGEEKGKLRMAIGDGPDRIEYYVSKTFTKKNQKGILKIEDASGRPIEGNPQAFLNSIRSRIAFDPLDILEKTDKNEIKKILFGVLGINLDDLDKKEKNLRSSRTMVGNNRDTAKISYEKLPSYPDETRTEELKADEMLVELNKAVQFNEQWDKDNNANEDIKKEALARVQKIKELEAEIKKIQDLNAEAKIAYQTAKEVLMLPENSKKDIKELSARVSGISEINQQVRANQTKATMKDTLAKEATLYESYTKQIEAIAKEKKDILTNAKWPISGLSYDAGELFFNAIPLDQVNDADRLRVGMGIAMALHPTFRVIWTRRGSLVDSKNRAIIAEMIHDQDFQMFFEGVAERDKDGNAPGVGFYIEEGEIVAVDGKAVEKKALPPTLPDPKPKPKVITEDVMFTNPQVNPDAQPAPSEEW